MYKARIELKSGDKFSCLLISDTLSLARDHARYLWPDACRILVSISRHQSYLDDPDYPQPRKRRRRR